MFRATRAASMKYTGTSLETLRQTAGSGFKNSTDSASKSIEERFPQVTEARIQGTKPHLSTKGPSETKDVVTISYYTGNGTRYLSIHVREDGSWKEYFSRAGKK